MDAITRAEKQTSGEVRVHIESYCPGSSLERAVFVFNQLKMFATQDRNAVLVYIAVESKKFCVIGDTGINAVVPENFWDEVKNQLQGCFVKGRFAEGLVVGIQMIGEKLKDRFPYKKEDLDELPNDISFGGDADA